MMKKQMVLLLSTILFQTAFAQSDEMISPVRDFDVDYTVYEARVEKNSFTKSAMSSASLYNESTLPKATEWASTEALEERFESIRDERFLVWKQDPATLRRATWFYPDDGCYARAAISMRNIFRSYAPMANKVFAFGNLKVKTENSPYGAVGWWYHVAPLVEVDHVKYVLDPSIEFARPITLKEWLERMGTPAKIKVAICASGTYTPGDSCERESDGLELHAETVEQYFLKSEWDRMVKLGREDEL